MALQCSTLYATIQLGGRDTKQAARCPPTFQTARVEDPPGLKSSFLEVQVQGTAKRCRKGMVPLDEPLIASFTELPPAGNGKSAVARMGFRRRCSSEVG